jgi:LPS export ABC transporter protein LptC
MRSVAKQVSPFLLPALLFGTMLLSACENDLNKIKEISAKFASVPVDTAKGVEVIYSDSAIIKGTMNTPLMINYSGATPYRVMPRGVKVTFFDHNSKENGNIVADSAVYHEKLVEFYKHVVATDISGKTFKSEELIWDQTKKIIYSNKSVEMTNPAGDVMYSTNFKSDESLSNPVWEQAHGVIWVAGNVLK